MTLTDRSSSRRSIAAGSWRHDHAVLVFEPFDQDINFIADFERFDVLEFGAGDDAFAFVADVHQDFFGADFDYFAFDNFACRKPHAGLLHGFFHREHNLTRDTAGTRDPNGGNQSSIA